MRQKRPKKESHPSSQIRKLRFLHCLRAIRSVNLSTFHMEGSANERHSFGKMGYGYTQTSSISLVSIHCLQFLMFFPNWVSVFVLFFLRCKHYRRRCMIRAPCCNEIYACRHCHNEATVYALLVYYYTHTHTPRHSFLGLFILF